MVEKIARLSTGKVSGVIQRGWIGLDKGKFFDVSLRITQQYEDAARFICQILGYTQADVRSMNCFQFHRELAAAEKQQQAQRKQAEKWQKSSKG